MLGMPGFVKRAGHGAVNAEIVSRDDASSNCLLFSSA